MHSPQLFVVTYEMLLNNCEKKLYNYLVFMLLTVDLFLQSYLGVEISSALATPQRFHLVSDIYKLIYVAVIVGLR